MACGGASGVADLARAATDDGCAAVAAGSLFVYRAKDQGVLINYPTAAQIAAEFEAETG